jgi:hypothetical protein
MRVTSWVRRVLTPVALLAVVIPALARPAGADVGSLLTGTFTDWSMLLPSVPNANDPTNPDICANGSATCVDHTIKKMANAAAPLVQSCSDDAVFAITYLRTTQTYQWARNQPGFFNDPGWVNYEDAVFSSFYFQAYQGWYSAPQNLSWVPQAWQIAFQAADAHAVTGAGNLLLGMNAHVNADLPVVLYEIGLVDANGNSRKPDHEAVNTFLDDEVNAVLVEDAGRFDPNINPPSTPDGIGDDALMQLLIGWRENAWNEAEALADAPDPAARGLVYDSIQQSAAQEAQALVAADSYSLSSETAASRAAYCMANRYWTTNVAYPWGFPDAKTLS